MSFVPLLKIVVRQPWRLRLGPRRLRRDRDAAAQPDGGRGAAAAQGGRHQEDSYCQSHSVTCRSVLMRHILLLGGRGHSFFLLPDSSAQCSVCWEDFKVGESVRQLVCDHLYHELCIVPWLEIHGTCPVCRYEIIFIFVVKRSHICVDRTRPNFDNCIEML